MVSFTLIEKNGREYTFPLPESMNEMTVGQLVFLSRQVEQALPIQEIKTNMLLYCMGARVTASPDPLRGGALQTWQSPSLGGVGEACIRARRHRFRLSADMLMAGTAVFDYLFIEGEDGRCYLDTRLTVCPYPKLWLWGRRYYAPEEALYGIVYDRYVLLETYFDRMQQDGEMVYAFLGTLLRPREKAFDKDRLSVRRMRHVSPRKVVLLTWYFVGSLRFIADKYPRIFSGGGGRVSKGARLSPYDEQQRLLDFIAKADPDRKIRMKHTELYEVLYSLDYIIEESERRQKEINDMKNRRRR